MTGYLAAGFNRSGRNAVPPDAHASQLAGGQRNAGPFRTAFLKPVRKIPGKRRNHRWAELVCALRGCRRLAVAGTWKGPFQEAPL